MPEEKHTANIEAHGELGVPTAAGIDSDELAGELAFELDDNIPCMNFLLTLSLF